MKTRNEDWDFPISRSFFTTDVWFRARPSVKLKPTIDVVFILANRHVLESDAWMLRSCSS
jgi:hypothetical protein